VTVKEESSRFGWKLLEGRECSGKMITMMANSSSVVTPLRGAGFVILIHSADLKDRGPPSIRAGQAGHHIPYPGRDHDMTYSIYKNGISLAGPGAARVR